MKRPYDIQNRFSGERSPSPANKETRPPGRLARLGINTAIVHDSTMLRIDEQTRALDAAIRDWNRLQRRRSRLEPGEMLDETLLRVLRIKDLAHRLSVTVYALRRETSASETDEDDET